jgi:hypothetical protein
MQVDQAGRHQLARRVDGLQRAGVRNFRLDRSDYAPANADIALAPQRLLGSSTSPPLITRSNLSAGPIAAQAEFVKRPDIAAAAADPVRLRKCRRDNADMLILPR